MKNYLMLSFILALTFIFATCTEMSVDSPKEVAEGKIVLKVDKENTPSNVYFILATLTREEFDPITSNLNFLSDSSADLAFNRVPVGEWHLLVEAMDNNQNILYKGDADLEVIENSVTNVTLVLEPVSSGTGTINLYVTWRDPNEKKWVDYNQNPIITSINSQYDYAGVQQPKVLYENGMYKMWFLGLANGSRSHVMYAESQDGLNWIRPLAEPVLSPGTGSSWDATATIAGAVLKEDSVYRMYYVGWNNQNSNWHIGMATSPDGKAWTKYPNPVFYGTSGWEYQVIPASILKVNNLYYLYYYGRNYPQYNIGLATSVDGITWTKYAGNPILSPTVNWESTGVFHSSVIKDGDLYKMVYMNSTGNAFGMASSSDGIVWNKNNSNPFFKNENTSGLWAGSGIAYPFYIKVNNTYRIYYSGLNYSSYYKIGVVESQ